MAENIATEQENVTATTAAEAAAPAEPAAEAAETAEATPATEATADTAAAVEAAAAARRERREKRRADAKKQGQASQMKTALLVVFGFLWCAIFTGLGMLMWGYNAFVRQTTVATATVGPLFIIGAAIFLACLVMTYIIRGGAVTPSLILAVVVFIFGLIMNGLGGINWLSALGKLALELFCAMAGFISGKLLYLRNHA
ncbi:MAG: hypothetical protein IKM70_04785 [Firmicutes bacterium]|nr:hypothetical protein [Bacillota bacterium]